MFHSGRMAFGKWRNHFANESEGTSILYALIPGHTWLLGLHVLVIVQRIYHLYGGNSLTLATYIISRGE